MNTTKNSRRPDRLDAALFVDIPSIAALAERCRSTRPGLPGLDDPQIQRFLRMARRVDPRPMLLDEEFSLRFRFELFAAMVVPLTELARCYAQVQDARRGRDDMFSIHLEAVTFTVQTLCAGMELFASINACAVRSTERVRRAIVDAQQVFARELAALLRRVSGILEAADLLSDDEAVTLACTMAYAARHLAVAGSGRPSVNERHIDAMRHH